MIEISAALGDSAQAFNSVNWQNTALGDPDSWPTRLRAATDIVLTSRFPMFLVWGPQHTFVHNQAYQPILGDKALKAMGLSLPEFWPSMWQSLEPLFDHVQKGNSVQGKDFLFVLERNEAVEECYMTFSLSPLLDEDHQVVGAICSTYETTSRVIKDRQMQLIADVGARALGVRSPSEAVKAALVAAAVSPECLPYLAIYLTGQNQDELFLAGQSTNLKSPSKFPATVSLNEPEGEWPLQKVFKEQKHQVLSTIDKNLPLSPWGVPLRQAVIIPILAQEQLPSGVIVAGVNPLRPLDLNYESFFLFFAKQVAQAVTNAMAFEKSAEINEFFSITSDLVCIIGPDGRFRRTSPSWKSTLGYDDEDLRGKHFSEIVHPDDLIRTEKEAARLLSESGARSVSYLNRVLHKNGSYRWLNWNSSGANGNVYSSAHDVTEQKEFEARLQQSKVAAEMASAAKSSFLANMSHEIRTPMSAILGFTELLRDDRLTESERNDAISRIDRSSRSLLRLIDDILDISKIESNKIDIQQSRFSPRELVGDVISLLRINAEQSHLNLRLDVMPDVPDIAYSDPTRIRQILVNLIGNAIKFTKFGEVQVTLTTENGKFLVFEVADTGIGISDTDQAKLFQPFGQADSSIARKFGGSGLGLALSRRLCERLGGNLLLVESKPGQGSRFKAFVDGSPFASFEQGASPRVDTRKSYTESQDHPLFGKSVLVAEDIADNQVLMRFYLEPAGAQVEFAGNGEEAIEKVHHKNYDIVLMDIQMPEVDGIQATKRLRAEGYKQPIVALTAHAMPEEVVRSLEAGCNAHLTKPIAKADLISAMLKFVSH